MDEGLKSLLRVCRHYRDCAMGRKNIRLGPGSRIQLHPMKPRLPATISVHKVGCVVVILALLVFPARKASAQTVYTWSAGDIVTGTITPSTVSTITSVDTLDITTSADHNFSGSVITNNGTINWQTGNLRSGNGGTITNNAAWNDSISGYQINNAYGGSGTFFVNAATGTYNKTTGTTDFEVGFTNAGTINVTGGALNLDVGGAFTNGSVVGSSGSGVLQLLGGTLTMTGNITATNFLFNGGTFAGDQTFTGSTVNWQAGNWNSANTTTLASNTTLNITGASDHDFNAHAIVNNGTINWVAGNIRSGNGGSITNNATWNDTASSQVNNAYGGAGTSFVNAAAGTYNKTAGTTDFTVGFTNAGTINVTGGALNLDAGGTFTNGSVVGSSGSGVLQLLGGTLTMTGNITAANFLFNGGTFAGDQTFTASTVNWQTGNWNSANTTTLTSNTTLNIIGASDHDLNAHAIVNNGTINWVAGNIRSGNGGSITNNATWNDTASSQVNNAYGGAGTSFVNAAAGTYNKLSGVTDFEVPFTNYGTVSVTGGTLNLNAGGTFYDGSAIGSTGTGVVQLTGGILSGGGTGGFTATNFLLTSGQLAGNMIFLGTTNWVASNFNTAGTATVGATGILNIATGNDHNFSSHAIINNGTVNWTAGNLRSGNGGSIANNATWNDSSDTYAINNAYGGSGSTFNNAATGVYNKTIGTTTFNDNVLVNDGTISVTGGVLNLVGGVLNNGSSIGSSGTGVVQLTSSLLTVNGTVNVQNFLLNGGQLTGTQTFAGSLSWLNGNLNTAASTTIGNGGTFTIATGNDHNFSSHAIINAGTVDWVAGNLRSGNGGVITNFGIWNDSINGYQINNAYGGSGTNFVNSATGVYNKTAGVTSFQVPLTNLGLINISGGTLALASTFTNTTGTVALASGTTLTSASPLTFGAGSLLRGDGAVTASAISVAGAIDPGTTTTAGQLSITGNLSLLATAQPTFELGGTTQGTQYDSLIVNGNLSLGGNLQIGFIGGFDTTVTNTMTFDLVTTSALSNSFLNAANGSRLYTADGLGSFIVNYGPGSGFGVNSVVISGFQAVPEPSTWALLLTGTGIVAFSLRRRFQ